ncbi:hypothetical protein QN411_24325, partial [Pseudomonas sp. CCI1.1]|nr:hypothetical protein [Pseudomonas sp. CCI1.1]
MHRFTAEFWMGQRSAISAAKISEVILFRLQKAHLGPFYFWCARHGALRASATSLAVVATLVTG